MKIVSTDKRIQDFLNRLDELEAEGKKEMSIQAVREWLQWAMEPKTDEALNSGDGTYKP